MPGERIDWGSTPTDPASRAPTELEKEEFRLTLDVWRGGYRSVAINATFGVNDLVLDASANSITFTLPASVEGKQYVAKNSGTGTVTVEADGAELIDGAATATLSTQYESITLVGTGSGWIII